MTHPPEGVSALPPDGRRAARAVEAALAAVRRRRTWLAIAAFGGGAGISVAVGLGVLWLLVAGGLRGPALAWIAGAVGLAALLTAAGATVGRALLRSRDPARVAAVLDRALGEDAVRLCVELLVEQRGGRLDHPYAVTRLSAHLVRTAGALAAVDSRRALPWRRGEQAAVLALPLAALAVVATLAPAPRDRLAAALQEPPPEATAPPMGEVTDGADLHLRDVEVALTPPAYTDEPPTRLPSGSGSFAALPGTAVQVRARVDAPPRSVSFQVGEGPWQPGELEGDDGVRVAFTLGRERSYEVRVETGEGDEPLSSGRLAILPREDTPPGVRILERTAEPVELMPGDGLAVQLALEDDHGLAGLERVLLRDGVEIGREPLALPAGTTTAARLEPRWTVPAGDALASGPISLRFDALDNDDVLGPKTGSSTPLRVVVLGERELRQRAIAAQEELLEILLLALGEHLLWQEGLDAGADPAETSGQARERMTRAMEAAVAVRDRMGADPAADGLAYAAVGSAMDETARSWDQLAQLLRRATIEEGLPDGLEAALETHIGNLERAALLLDRQRTRAREALAADAARRAAEGMETLRQALESGDEAAIAEAMAALQRQLAELAGEMGEMDAGPADAWMNREGGAGGDLMSRVQELLAQGRTEEAQALLAEGARAMAQFQQQGGADAAQALAQLDEALAGVRELAGTQRELNRQIGALESAFPGAAQPAGLEELAVEVEDLRERVAGLEEGTMSPRMGGVVRGRTRRSGRYLEDAVEGLRQGDVDPAIRGLARSDNELLDLMEMAEVIEQAGSSGMGEEAFEDWTGALAEAEADHMGLVERLLAAERDWRDARGSVGQAAGPLAGQQRRAAEEATAIGEALGGLDGLSLDGASQRRTLDDAGQLMNGAADDMESGRIARARDSGEQAIARLDQLAGDLECMRETVQQAAASSGSIPMDAVAGNHWRRVGEGNGLDPTTGMVEIPPPGRFAGPEELREAALEAATEDAPPDYRPLNDRYYEELVR